MKKQIKYWKYFTLGLAPICLFGIVYLIYEYREQKEMLDGDVRNSFAPTSDGGIRPTQDMIESARKEEVFINEMKFKYPTWDIQICNDCKELRRVGVSRIDIPVFSSDGYTRIPVEYFRSAVEEIIHASATATVQQLGPFNLSSDPHLLGIAHHIFTARIMFEKGNEPTEIGPRTQYSAEIISNIKGELSGVITIDLLGGWEDGIRVPVEGFPEDGYFLKPGFTYLLATRYNDTENWYTVVAHPNGQKVLNTDAFSTQESLLSIINGDEKV